MKSLEKRMETIYTPSLEAHIGITYTLTPNKKRNNRIKEKREREKRKERKEKKRKRKLKHSYTPNLESYRPHM